VPELWLLDCDGVVVAPRERDLMFVVDGVLADAPVTAEQQSWFFDGYGHHEIDPALLAYYRSVPDRNRRARRRRAAPTVS
jgi:spectinomycin phosphotransferase